MKNIFLLLLTLPALLLAQEKPQTVTLKTNYNPETTFLLSKKMDMSNTVTFKGSVEELEAIKANGVQNPMVKEMSLDYIMEVKTGKQAADKSFPIIFEYKKTPEVMGKRIIEPGAKIYGTGKPNALPVFERVDSESGSDAINKGLVTSVNKIFEQIKYPVAPFKVGDSQSVTMPFTFPAGGVSIDMDMVIVYKLVSIVNDKANFNMSYKYNIKLNDAFSATGTGSGIGTMVYDLKYSLATLHNSDIHMNMQVEASGINMELNTKMKQVLTTQIQPNK